MAELYKQRMTAEMDGEFVVFLIGMRFNKPWKVPKWLPVFLAMPGMLKELAAQPDSEFVGCRQFLGVIVRDWRSFDHLERYARNRDAHWSPWVAFDRNVGVAGGDVGIRHETYRIPSPVASRM